MRGKYLIFGSWTSGENQPQAQIAEKEEGGQTQDAQIRQFEYILGSVPVRLAHGGEIRIW